MSDDLVKRLRTPVGFQDLPHIQEEAADRIEELEAKLDDKEAECRCLRGQVNMAEAKLAKSVEALKWCDKAHDSLVARNTLKELKGETDAPT